MNVMPSQRLLAKLEMALDFGLRGKSHQHRKTLIVCVSRDLIYTTSSTSEKECPRKERAQRKGISTSVCAIEELRWQSSDDAHRWWHAVTLRVETGSDQLRARESATWNRTQ